MDKDLVNKVALVTGGSRGIGAAISSALASRGADIAIAYLRKKQAAESMCLRLEGLGVKAKAIRCNVGDAEQLDGLFEEVELTFGRLDIFVSNAATGVIRPVQELDAHAWEWTMNANAQALMLGASRAARLMPTGGSIVALSSLGSSRVLPGYAAVGASKAAIESLVRYLSVELAPQVRVNCVSPGVVDTDALTHFPMRDRMLADARSKTPAGRIAEPPDVAAVVDFLTSDAARMVTGQIIVVDGGASLVA